MNPELESPVSALVLPALLGGLFLWAWLVDEAKKSKARRSRRRWGR